MARVEQSFVNRNKVPIYVSVEPWPECFELEPGEELTLIYDATDDGNTVQIDFVNTQELVVWPKGQIDDIKYLINGQPGEDRSWAFKHR